MEIKAQLHTVGYISGSGAFTTISYRFANTHSHMLYIHFTYMSGYYMLVCWELLYVGSKRIHIVSISFLLYITETQKATQQQRRNNRTTSQEGGRKWKQTNVPEKSM